jgi:hypothetical protein
MDQATASMTCIAEVPGSNLDGDTGCAEVESGLQSALNRCTARPLTESDDTRCCKNTILTS